MRIAFRTDSSFQIGTGHLMRCLTLADALARRGHDVLFVCRALEGNVNALVRDRKYRLQVLPPPTSSRAQIDNEDALAHASWLGVSPEVDVKQTAEALALAGGAKIDWLVVDHYALDFHWEMQLRNCCTQLMVIDDLADRSHICDLLLDQNLGRTPTAYAHLVPSGCKVLAGLRYALLRPEFPVLRKYSLARRANPQMKRLLISMGGVDKDNSTGRVLEVLRRRMLLTDCRVTVILGSHAPWLGDVRALAEEMPARTEVLVNVRNMAWVMAESDFAIGAAGSTSWERCALGLPTLLLLLAENQREVARLLISNRAARLLDLGEHFPKQLFDHLDEISRQPAILKRMSINASGLCDGKGTTRVVNEFVDL